MIRVDKIRKHTSEWLFAKTTKTDCSKNRCKIKVLPQRLIMIIYTTLTMKEKSWFFLFVP